MIDNTDNETLRAQVADLGRRLTEHEAMRTGAIDALAGVSDRLARMQTFVAAQPLHPVAEARQREGTLEHYAVLATRVRNMEEAFDELLRFNVDLFSFVRDTKDAVDGVRQLLEDIRLHL
jgi:hypothetical protein